LVGKEEGVLDGKTLTIWDCFGGLRDPRTSRRRKRHPLLSIVAIALCASIAGAQDWPQVVAFGRARRDWLATFLDVTAQRPGRSRGIGRPERWASRASVR
jgi:hypothetical protein